MAPKKLIIPLQEIPKKRVGANGVRLPDQLCEGELLTDSSQKTWRLGRSIGVGGFGEIYLASDELNRTVKDDAKYVIKVERHSNGPLFVEKNFYIRATQVGKINEWVARKGLKALGVPCYLGTGSHVFDGEKYRFLVLPRFGIDIEKVFIQQGRKFHIKTAFTIAIHVMDALEYIHAHDYIHADIKGSNLLLGRAEAQAPVYLTDFGLATRYLHPDGRHKCYQYDGRRAHEGTLEFTSRDAHVGVQSRRGDLEVLGYNLVQWLCGRLPWEGETDAEAVKKQKTQAMNNIGTFLHNCFKPLQPPDALHHYLQFVAHLAFESQPNYKYCKRLFHKGIQEAGFQDDGKLTFHSHAKKANKRKPVYEPENKYVCVKKKCVRPSREPCITKNINRITRNAVSTLPTLRSKNEFTWWKVLAGDPEKMLRKCSEKKLKNSPCHKAVKPQTEQDTPIRPVQSRCQLDNPTPAMLQVMSLRERQPSSGRHSKSESRCSSPVEMSYDTPAMESVRQRKKSESESEPRFNARASRVARRNSVKAAPPAMLHFKKSTYLAPRRLTRHSSLKG